jgi:hypothetical protein
MWISGDAGALFSAGLPQYGQLGHGGALQVESSCPIAHSLQPFKPITYNLSSEKTGFKVCLSSTPPAALRHGTDHEYNMKDGSVKLAYMAQPSPRWGAARRIKLTHCP